MRKIILEGAGRNIGYFCTVIVNLFIPTSREEHINIEVQGSMGQVNGERKFFSARPMIYE